MTNNQSFKEKLTELLNQNPECFHMREMFEVFLCSSISAIDELHDIKTKQPREIALVRTKLEEAWLWYCTAIKKGESNA